VSCSRPRPRRRDTNSLSFSSPDSDYSPNLGQVLVGQEGAFRGTRFRVAIPYNYEQPPSSTGMMSPEPLRGLFQWTDEEEEASGYASSVTVSYVQTGRVSANMADNNNNDDDFCRRLEAREQTSRAQQEALNNIQRMLNQLLTNQNNNDTGSNHEEEEHNNTEPPKTEKLKAGSSLDADVLKGIQAQIASLTQRDELKKVGMTRPCPLEWDSVPYPLKFKQPMLHV